MKSEAMSRWISSELSLECLGLALTLAIGLMFGQIDVLMQRLIEMFI